MQIKFFFVGHKLFGRHMHVDSYIDKASRDVDLISSTNTRVTPFLVLIFLSMSSDISTRP